MQWQGERAIAMDSQSQIHTSCCIHRSVLHDSLYLVTPHGFPLGEREFFLQDCRVSTVTMYSMHEPAISSIEWSYCYISAAGKQQARSFFRLQSSLSPFPLLLPLPPPPFSSPSRSLSLFPQPSHPHTQHSAQRNTLLSLLLASSQHTLFIPLNTNLLPSPQNSQNSPEGLGFSITNIKKTSRLFLNSVLHCLP